MESSFLFDNPEPSSATKANQSLQRLAVSESIDLGMDQASSEGDPDE